MLIQENQVLSPGEVLNLIAILNGDSAESKQIKTGIYEIGHFGSSDFMWGYDHYPTLSIGSYGVCDSVEQLLAACPELESDQQRKFVVTVTKVTRESQSPEGGWRWHKWGEYIGTQNPQHEYLYDDKHIDEVLVYHIYERK